MTKSMIILDTDKRTRVHGYLKNYECAILGNKEIGDKLLCSKD